jgi:hypothetical protein
MPENAHKCTRIYNEDQIAITKTFNINIILYSASECTMRMWDVVYVYRRM